MRDRRVNLHGFQRLVALLALGQELEGTGIVQSVSQLDEDNADILRHGEEHLAQVLELLLLLGVAQHAQSGYAVHQLRDRRAEFVFDLLVAELGVLNAVMQQRCTNGIRIQPHLHNDLGDSDRMNDIRLTVAALLSLMCLGRTFVCRANLLDIRLRVLFLYAFDQKIQFRLHRFFPHSCHPAMLCNVARTTDPEISALPS